MSPHDAAQIHGEVAAIVSIVIIIAGIWFFGCHEKRRRAGATPSGEAS
jgi:hypothetical protein